MKGFRLLPLVVALSLTSLMACRGKPTREWRAEDHDEEPGSAQPPGGMPAGAAASGAQAAATDEALVDSAWKVSCSECHGMSGRGDGPKAPMTQPPNLTDPTYLAGRTDEQLAAVIKGGKGKMPAFSALTPNLVNGLIRRVRSLSGS